MFPQDIARIMELDYEQFLAELRNEHSYISRSYWSGILKTEVEIRSALHGKLISNSEDLSIIDIDTAKLRYTELQIFRSKLNQILYD